MVIRINPSQQSVWRNNDELQIGLGENKLTLRKLSRGQERLIALLYKGVADELVEPMAKELGASDTAELLKQLQPMLLPKNTKPDRLSDDYVATAFAELAKATLLHSTDGAQVLSYRMARTVHLDSLDKTGLLMLKALAAAGVGRVASDDHERVQESDTSNLGYEREFLNGSRFQAASEILELGVAPTLLENSLNYDAAKIDSIDLAVLIAHQAITPRSYAKWLNRDVPHIAIVYEADSVWVSPLIIRGKTACLFCLDMHKTELDDAWPTIATQLLQSNQRFDDSSSSLFAVSLVLQKITAHLDGISGFESTASEQVGYRLDSSSGEVREVTWNLNASCDCRIEGD